MSFIGNNPKWNTSTYTPQAADPTNPTEGQVFYSDGTSRAEGLYVYKNGNFTSVGSGSGALNFYDQGDAEQGSTSDFTTGNNATFDGGGTFNGTFSVSTTAADLINGSNVYKYVGSATASSNDDNYIASTAIPVPQGYRGRLLLAKGQYKWDGTSDNIKVVIKDQTNGTIITPVTTTLTQHDSTDNTSKEFQVQFFCPSDAANLKFGFQVITGEVSPTLLWDDVLITPNVEVIANIQDENTFSATITNSGTAAISSQSGPTDWIASVNRSAAGAVDITLTSSFFGASPSVTVSAINASANGEQATVVSTSTSTISILTEDASNTNTDEDFNIIVQRQGSDYRQKNEAVVIHTDPNIQDSMVRLDTANGHGSTATKVRRFTTTQSSIGSAITYADSAANGSSFTINESGVYHISYTDSFSTSTFHGISLNASDLTVDIQTLADSEALNYIDQASTQPANVSWAGKLTKDDVVRAHTRGQTDSGNLDRTRFTITKIGQANLVANPIPQTVFIKDSKSNSTASGTFTSGSYQTRDVTLLEGDTGFVSLSSNQITLQPGTYNVAVDCRAFKVNNHKCKLRDTTNSADAILGSSSHSGSADSATTTSSLKGRISISATTTYEVQHRCETTRATNGFGTSMSFGDNEIFLSGSITKIS